MNLHLEKPAALVQHWHLSLKFKPNAMLHEDPKIDSLLTFSLLFRMLMISCTAEDEIPKFLAIVRLLSYLLMNQQGLLVMLESGFVVATSHIITEKIYTLYSFTFYKPERCDGSMNWRTVLLEDSRQEGYENMMDDRLLSLLEVWGECVRSHLVKVAYY